MDKVQGDKPRIQWVHWAWVLLTFLFLFFRLQNIQGVFTKEGVIINDTDPYYRLHRIESMVKTGKPYPLHETKLNSPTGFDVAWPLGLDILISIPLKLYNSTSRAEIESFGAVIIPFLSLPLLWFSGWIGTNMGGALLGILLGLFITCSSTLIYQSGLGRLDHHFIEATLPIMFLMFVHRFLRTKEKYLEIGMILILGLAPSFLAQGWIVAPLLILGLILERKWEAFHDFSKILYASFALSFLCLSFSDRFQDGFIQWNFFSWWAPFIYLLGSFSLEFIFLWMHPQKRKWNGFSLLLKSTFLIVLFFLLYKNSANFIADNISDPFRSIVTKQGTLSITMEARSPFELSFDRMIHSDTLILIFAALGMLYFIFQQSHRFLMGYAMIPILLSFFQIRFMAMGLPLMFLIILLCMKELIDKISWKPWRRGILMALACLVLIVPFKPYFGFTMFENMHFYFKPIRTFCMFLNQQYKDKHQAKGFDPIIAHWDYGHWLLYYTGLPVVANPFQGDSALEVLELFTSKGTDQLEPFLLRHPSKYLVIESGAQRTLGWLQTTGKTRSCILKKWVKSMVKTIFKPHRFMMICSCIASFLSWVEDSITITLDIGV
ncbi:MAG: hypothetical protein R2877_08630 [Bdellovibrionota bacterium]